MYVAIAGVKQAKAQINFSLYASIASWKRLKAKLLMSSKRNLNQLWEYLPLVKDACYTHSY